MFVFFQGNVHYNLRIIYGTWKYYVGVRTYDPPGSPLASVNSRIDRVYTQTRAKRRTTNFVRVSFVAGENFVRAESPNA